MRMRHKFNGFIGLNQVDTKSNIHDRIRSFDSIEMGENHDAF